MAEDSPGPSGSSTHRSHWKTRTGFILAAAGSAVGLGNIWKFPYITGENGGGLFVLIYLICIALVGLPILIAEIMIGRAAQAQPVLAFKKLQGGRTGWSLVGWLGVVAGFIILSFYIVVAGWAMDYTLKSVAGVTNNISHKADEQALVYEATTPLSEMRSALYEHRVSSLTNDAEKSWRRQFAPSTWELYEQYQAVQIIVPEDAQNLLRNNDVMSAAVNAAMGHHSQKERVAETNRIRATATEELRELSSDQIRTEATALVRRSHIRDQVSAIFGGLVGDGWTSTFWAAIFMFLTILVIATGVGNGIERACRILMPVLILSIVGLVIYGIFQPGFGRAVSFVFSPDPTSLEARGVLEALGHAFFTLSLGMGAMMTYGSYQRRASGGLLGESVAIAVLDTAIALLACLMMFPIIFSYGQDPSGGPGLVFMSMPLAFAEMGKFGMLLGIVFFGLLVFAALTSAISLLEVVASYLIDAHEWTRARAAWTMGSVIMVFGIITAFSSSKGFLMASWLPGYGQSFFDTMDVLSSNWMLPLGGLFIAIYAGWIMPERLRDAEISDMNGLIASSWLVLVRFVAPVMVVIVLLDKIGLIDVNEIAFQLMH